MYVAFWGPWMSMDYRTQLPGPVAHRDLVRTVHASLTVIHQHSERLRLSDTFARPDRSD
jgi:hypothetical protein